MDMQSGLHNLNLSNSAENLIKMNTSDKNTSYDIKASNEMSPMSASSSGTSSPLSLSFNANTSGGNLASISDTSVMQCSVCGDKATGTIK